MESLKLLPVKHQSALSRPPRDHFCNQKLIKNRTRFEPLFDIDFYSVLDQNWLHFDFHIGIEIVYKWATLIKSFHSGCGSPLGPPPGVGVPLAAKIALGEANGQGQAAPQDP